MKVRQRGDFHIIYLYSNINNSVNYFSYHFLHAQRKTFIFLGGGGGGRVLLCEPRSNSARAHCHVEMDIQLNTGKNQIFMTQSRIIGHCHVDGTSHVRKMGFFHVDNGGWGSPTLPT